ncbi:MAG: hypothetical protein J7578_06560, partial [Chitinophagaceae bacterium]|nr:hypothetical protein [Chitinophagaceae bacterium]
MKRGYLLLPLHFLLGYLMIAGQSFGQSDQSPPPFNYSIPVQRLQLKLTTSFVFFSLYGRLDMD